MIKTMANSILVVPEDIEKYLNNLDIIKYKEDEYFVIGKKLIIDKNKVDWEVLVDTPQNYMAKVAEAEKKRLEDLKKEKVVE